MDIRSQSIMKMKLSLGFVISSSKFGWRWIFIYLIMKLPVCYSSSSSMNDHIPSRFTPKSLYGKNVLIQLSCMVKKLFGDSKMDTFDISILYIIKLDFCQFLWYNWNDLVISVVPWHRLGIYLIMMFFRWCHNYRF